MVKNNFQTVALVGCSHSAEVRTYKKWSKKENYPTSERVMGLSSLMHVGSKSWPV